MTTADLEDALRMDRLLCEVALSIDFLLAVTPVNIPEAWRDFHAGRYRKEPTFRYREPSPDLPLLRGQLEEVDPFGIEQPDLQSMLINKYDELELQLDCLEARNTERFLKLSSELYGGVEPTLLELADTILQGCSVTAKAPKEKRVGSRAFAKRAQLELARYRSTCPQLESRVHVLDDVAGIMAFEGDLLIGRTVSVPASRVEALIQHEVGTHILTYANGAAHRLGLLHVGLAGYDQTQEALAVFSEYVVGGLTGARLAQLAARVIAVEGLLSEAGFTEVFSTLRKRYRVPPRAAFQVVARVFRGGGFPKDAIYLRGIAELLSYLADGGELEPMFTGKLAFRDLPSLPRLQELGLLGTPPLTPRWTESTEARDRIDAARQGMSVVDLTREASA